MTAVSLADIKEYARRSAPAIASFAAPVYGAQPRLERPALADNEALVATSIDALPAWELAAQLGARTFALVTPSRGCMFDHLLTIGLFAITAGPSDFYARLLSRATALPGMPPQGEIDLRLLSDTAHHAARAITDHVGHRLSEAERATLIERLWRATQLARTPTFVARPDAYAHLQQLARTQNVQVIWGDPTTHMTGGEIARMLADRRAVVGCLALFEHDGLWSRAFDASAWKRVAASPDATVLLASLQSTTECPLADVLQQPVSARAPVAEPDVAQALATGNTEAVMRLLEEALRLPLPQLLGPLFAFVAEHRPMLEAHATEEGRALLSLCDATELHDDDTAWRALAHGLLDAPEGEQIHHANALAFRLGLFS